MLADYDTCQQIAKSHQCADCRGRSALLVRHRPAPSTATKEYTAWEVYCPACGNTDRFVKRESQTARWRRDPESVPVHVANRLARKYHQDIETVAEGLPPELAAAVRQTYFGKEK
jgi:hypothetical protein